jgi:Type IV secretion-system coupling protein DNA-binding domain
MTAAVFLLVGGLSILGLILAARAFDGWSWRRSLVAYRLRLPSRATADDVTRWLGAVAIHGYAPSWALLPSPPVVLEVEATRAGIEFFVLTPHRSQDALLVGVRAALPGARLEEMPDYLSAKHRFRAAAEFWLTHAQRPLAVDRAEASSTALLAALQPLHGEERVRLQWIMTGGGTPPVVPATAEDARATKLKQAEPLLRVVGRLGVAAPGRDRAWSLFGRVRSSLRALNTPGVQVSRRFAASGSVVTRLERRSLPLTRWPLPLNAREAAGLFGLVSTVPLPGMSAGTARQLPPSPAQPSRGLVVAESNYPGITRSLALHAEDRLRHTWMVGPTGVGKSTLIANMVLQDIRAGFGTVVVDPKGDLVADTLERVPDGRADDVIVLDPSAVHQPVGFNPLRASGGELARELAMDHLIHVFGSIWRSSWGPRTADVLRNGLLTLMNTKAPDGSAFTLVELAPLLLDPSFRRSVLAQSTVPAAVRPFWTRYEAMSEAERAQVIAPSLNKIDALTTTSSTRLLLGQSEGIDLGSVFWGRKTLLVSLAKGAVGTETAQLLGALLVASLWQTTLARVAVPAAKRRPVFMYLDEFQDVLKLPLELADMLAQARGLGVGLVLAHQHLGQLPDAVKTAVLGTARTQITFQLDHDDARALERRLAPLTAADLMGLEAYEIAMRPSVGGATLVPVTGRTSPLPEPVRDGAALAEQSRRHYGAARADVETALDARLNAGNVGSPGRRRRQGGSS